MAKLLVVDDDRDVVELLNYLLERHGHQILEAENGREGLETVVREQPDLIILDIMMPEMNGFVMNTHLLENQATRDIPVIILTAKGQARDAFELTPNIRYFMEKPFDPKDLQSKVLEVLRQN
jgi:DNA-binding response OmpR family regulator